MDHIIVHDDVGKWEQNTPCGFLPQRRVRPPHWHSRCQPVVGLLLGCASPGVPGMSPWLLLGVVQLPAIGSNHGELIPAAPPSRIGLVVLHCRKRMVMRDINKSHQSSRVIWITPSLTIAVYTTILGLNSTSYRAYNQVYNQPLVITTSYNHHNHFFWLTSVITHTTSLLIHHGGTQIGGIQGHLLRRTSVLPGSNHQLQRPIESGPSRFSAIPVWAKMTGLVVGSATFDHF